MKNTITACIDGSAITTSVCDTASWASAALEAPLTLLHVLEKVFTPAREDLSGAIGLGSREFLLSELTELDERRNRLAVEHGRHMLNDARQRAEAQGAHNVSTEQCHDQLLPALLACEPDTRLFVIGRQGADHETHAHSIGSHVESLVRAVNTPVLVATGQFSRPCNYMLAYDGSDNADRAIARIAHTQLLSDLPGHLVMIAPETPENRQRLAQACAVLASCGHAVQIHLLQGSVVETLSEFQQAHAIELKVMGAYGHSRIREFFVGSHTRRMIADSHVPLLLLR